MHRFISKLVTKLKGEVFILDSNIPLTYLLSFLWTKTISLIYGFLLFGKGKSFFVHPSTQIKCRTKIKAGKNLNIDRNCFIDALSVDGIIFGDNVSIGKQTVIEGTGSLRNLGKGLIVGNRVGLGTHGFWGCAGGIEIGDDTIFGNYVSLHSENHNFQAFDILIRMQGVTHLGIKIGKNCWLGAKVTVLDGAVIGDGCVVAAGSVVKGVIPPNSVIGGIPAKPLKERR